MSDDNQAAAALLIIVAVAVIIAIYLKHKTPKKTVQPSAPVTVTASAAPTSTTTVSTASGPVASPVVSTQPTSTNQAPAITPTNPPASPVATPPTVATPPVVVTSAPTPAPALVNAIIGYNNTGGVITPEYAMVAPNQVPSAYALQLSYAAAQGQGQVPVAQTNQGTPQTPCTAIYGYDPVVILQQGSPVMPLAFFDWSITTPAYVGHTWNYDNQNANSDGSITWTSTDGTNTQLTWNKNIYLYQGQYSDLSLYFAGGCSEG